MKFIWGIIGILVIIIIGFIVWSPPNAPADMSNENPLITAESDVDSMAMERSIVATGEYAVLPERSTITWAGKKPLIEGYVNSGSIAVSGGTISVEDNSAAGEFVFDMTTLSVSETPTKPGQESALEGHLKGERWFDTETYPTATFVITEITPRTDSDTTFTYDVSGSLTMKGTTDTLQFPAIIYLDQAGLIHASANLEFDRTNWGITSGSGSFFDNLADNVIDDMVALSFELVAEQS